MDEEVVPDDIQKRGRRQGSIGGCSSAALPTLKQGVITRMFKIKGGFLWAITRVEKLQVLPNDLSLDEWYVHALPTVWPDVTNIHPQRRLLQQHLETKGPGWYPLAEREERLFTNRSNRPGDDMKDELRTDSDPIAWRIWRLHRTSYGSYVSQLHP